MDEDCREAIPGQGLDSVMKNIEGTSESIATTPRREARCFAHHYGGIQRRVAAGRVLRVYPPLGWGLPHVRRALGCALGRATGKRAEPLDALQRPRATLTL